MFISLAGGGGGGGAPRGGLIGGGGGGGGGGEGTSHGSKCAVCAFPFLGINHFLFITFLKS